MSEVRFSINPWSEKGDFLVAFTALEARKRLIHVNTWCVEQFGTERRWDNQSQSATWRQVGSTFLFLNQADATVFKLRWC